MKKILTFAVSVSMVTLLLVPSISHADDEGTPLGQDTYLISDELGTTPLVSNIEAGQLTEDEIVDTPIGITEPAAATNYSIVQQITGAALSNEHLTNELVNSLNNYLVDSFTNGDIDVLKYDEIVNSGLISENAFFANSVFVGDSLTVGFEQYCKSKNSIATDTTYFLARVSGTAKACISPNALTTFANIMPKYNGKVQLVEDSIAEIGGIEKMFICYGMNDLTGNKPETFVADMKTLIGRIIDKNPGIKVYVISIPCVAKSVDTGYLNNANIAKANVLLQEMCAENGYGFINIFEHLMGSDNAIKNEYSSDKYVHETTAAYTVWNNVLKDYAFSEITR